MPVHPNLDEWIARDAIPFTLDTPGSLDSAIAGDRRAGPAVGLLGLGEALHGSEEILLIRNRMFHRLVAVGEPTGPRWVGAKCRACAYPPVCWDDETQRRRMPCAPFKKVEVIVKWQVRAGRRAARVEERGQAAGRKPDTIREIQHANRRAMLEEERLQSPDRRPRPAQRRPTRPPTPGPHAPGSGSGR